jgi:hypothetical protein
LDFNPTGELLAALCYDEIQRKYSVELFDTESRKRVAAPTAYNHTRHGLAWNPVADTPLLAVYGELEKEQGDVQLMQINHTK